MRSTRSSIYFFSITFFAISLATVSSGRAQTPAATPAPTPVAARSPTLEHEFFKNILRDQKAIWTSPLHLERDDAKWMVPFGLGTMALITTDRMTGDEIGESDRQLKASRVISYAGSIYSVAATAGTFYLLGRKTKNARARETGILSAEALVDSAIVVEALKGITQRERPTAGSERSEFFDGGNSFPSGHSIQAWTVATIVADEYHDHRVVQVAAYGTASAVSLSRYTGGKHYLSDVLVGSALGYGIGQYVYHAHHRKTTDSTDQHDEQTERWPAITPQYSRRTHEYGVALTWRF
jgi:membrane-associated phospholipid phosphatase